jgi:pimeloyl-ACP methyl ester carboxylesterase
LDGPGVSETDTARVSVPTVVIGNERDAVHPMSIAEELARLIPGARLVAIPSKSDDRDGYRSGFQHAITQFLKDL